MRQRGKYCCIEKLKNEFDRIQAPQEIAGFFVSPSPSGEGWGEANKFQSIYVKQTILNLTKMKK